MKKFILLLFVLMPLICFSQTDSTSTSVASRIAGYKPSKKDLISKGRHMLLDEFRLDNMDAVAEIVHYFETDINDSYTIGLWPVEQVLLHYWTENYDMIIDFNNYRLDEIPEYRNRQMTCPADYSIYYDVVNACMDDFDYLIDKIREQAYSEDAEDFLILLLERILAEEDPKFISMEDVNKGADRFLTDYPNSPMAEVVKKHISYKLGIGDWCFGLYFGGGLTFPSGNMTDYFNPRGGLCISMDLFYKRTAFFLSVQSGFGDTRQDIPINNYDYWEKGGSFEFTSVGLCLGYSIFDNTKLRVTPFAGMSFGSAYPAGEDIDKELKKFNVGTSVSEIFGVNITYRFINLNTLSRKIYQYQSQPFGSFGINARFAYVPSILGQEGHKYAGNMFYMTLGINMDFFEVVTK